MNLLSTLKGSLLESFFPAGWDLAEWDVCVADDPAAVFDRQPKWHNGFSIRMASTVADFDVMLGHELAMEILRCRETSRNRSGLTRGPNGHVPVDGLFPPRLNIPCDRVFRLQYGRMDDSEGNTLASGSPGAFQTAMEAAFYGPLASLTVPPGQRFFATRQQLPDTGSDRCPAQRRRSWWWFMALGGHAILPFGNLTLGASSPPTMTGATRPIAWAPSCIH